MTSGVEEHHLQMEATTNGHRRDWLIYDVGGHRSNVRNQCLILLIMAFLFGAYSDTSGYPILKTVSIRYMHKGRC